MVTYTRSHSARELLYLPAMSKTSKRSKRTRRTSKTVDRSTTTDVVSQLECAIKNPHAALIGALIGGLVPWFGRTLAHDQLPSAWTDGNTGLAMTMLAVVLGCAAFSAISVYKFGKAAFGDTRKALGFTLALEGVMLVSHGATSNVALAVLIAINAVANGSVIALAREAANKKRDAMRRASETRARKRAPSSVAAVPAEAVPAARPMPITPAMMFDVIDAEIVSEENFA
jgi:hypothetical protein